MRAGIPHLQDGRQVSVFPVHGKGAAIDQHQHHRLPGSVQGHQQVALAARQVQRGPGPAFAAGTVRASHHGHDHVAFACQGHRLVYPVLFLTGKRRREQFGFRPVRVHEVAALNISHLGFSAHQGFDALQRAHHVDIFRSVMVACVFDGGRIRPHHRNALEVLELQRQHAVILQQHGALAGCAQGNFLIFRFFHFLIGPLEIPLVRVVEQTQKEFGAQDVADAVIDHRHRHHPLGDGFAQREHKSIGFPEGAADIHAAEDGLRGRFFLGRCGPMLGVEILHRLAVRYDIPPETPLVAQAFHHPVVAGGHGKTVIVVIRYHCAHEAGLADHPAPDIGMDVFQFAGRHLRVAPGLGFARPLVVGVGQKVLARGQDVFLQAPGKLNPQFGHQIGAFAEGFLTPTPALVADDVQDGTIGIGIAHHPGFAAGHASHFVQQFLVPGGAQPQRSGEAGRAEGFVAVDAFVGEIHRNPQPGFLDKPFLDGIQGPGVLGSRPGVLALIGGFGGGVETVQMLVDGPHAILPQPGFPTRCGEFILEDAVIPIQGDQLAGFLLEGHLLQQVLDAVFQPRSRILIDIPDPVFVEIDPSFPVDFVLPGRIGVGIFLGLQRKHGHQGKEGMEKRFHGILISSKYTDSALDYKNNNSIFEKN